MAEVMEKDSGSYFKLEFDRVKNEVKFEVVGLNVLEVLKFAFGICQDAISKIQPFEKSKIVKPDIKDSVIINRTKH